MALKYSFPLSLLLAVACNTTPSSEAPATIVSVPPATSASAPSFAAVAAPSASSGAAASRALHYDFVLTTSDGKASSRTSFSVDLTDAAPGSISFAKNAPLPSGARIDVGTRLKCRLSFDGETPHLDVDAEITTLDSTGKMHKTQAHGAPATPLGDATVVIDTSDAGVTFKLTATPTAGAPLEAKGAEAPNAAYVVDISIAHTGDGAAPAPTALTLNLSGDAPAIAKTSLDVPLQVTDAGFSPRQVVGSRVKATGRARGGSLVMDYDFEESAIEPATPSARIRKIVARGQLVAPFDKPTVAFAGEEDGHRYVLTLTPHRGK